jgi:Fe-S-cluster-containing hydrogenase component 2
MKLVCRKCGVACPVDNMTFNDVKYFQSLECGVGGLHQLVGVNE